MSPIKLVNETTGKFFLSNYGLYDALFFEGDDGFLRRAQNFCINCGVVKSGRFFSPKPNLMYCLAPKERILKGFIEQIRLDIFINLREEDKKEIGYFTRKDMDGGVQVDFDEGKLMELATKRGTDYFNSLEQNNLLDFIKKEENCDFYEICA